MFAIVNTNVASLSVQKNLNNAANALQTSMTRLSSDTEFTSAYAKGQVIRSPVAHHDGNYFADADTLKALEDNGQVVFRYAEGTNPNGSVNDIAGVMNAKGNVLGMMPHPENLIEAAHGGNDGRGLFASALGVIAA